jgi:maltooligosyltrehalose synthase
MGGSPVIDDTRKLFLILRLLGLRARRPEPFVSAAYEPLDAGADVCAFVRAGAVLVVVGVRAECRESTLSDAPRGRWREVLTGEERSFDAHQRVGRLVGEHGIAVFERLGPAG